MTKDEGNPNDKMTKALTCAAFSSFGFCHSFVIRASSFSRFELRENLICVLERFLAPDIEPFAFDLKRFYRFARVEPLYKTTWLIRIIAGSQIRRYKRESRRRIIVN